MKSRPSVHTNRNFHFFDSVEFASEYNRCVIGVAWCTRCELSHQRRTMMCTRVFALPRSTSSLGASSGWRRFHGLLVDNVLDLSVSVRCRMVAIVPQDVRSLRDSFDAAARASPVLELRVGGMPYGSSRSASRPNGLLWSLGQRCERAYLEVEGRNQLKSSVHCALRSLASLPL